MIYRENFTIREILVSLCFWRFINNVIDLPSLPPTSRPLQFYRYIYISFNVHAYVQAHTPAKYAGRHVICPCPISFLRSFYFILRCPISLAAAPLFYNDVDPMTLKPRHNRWIADSRPHTGNDNETDIFATGFHFKKKKKTNTLAPNFFAIL